MYANKVAINTFLSFEPEIFIKILDDNGIAGRIHTVPWMRSDLSWAVRWRKGLEPSDAEEAGEVETCRFPRGKRRRMVPTEGQLSSKIKLLEFKSARRREGTHTKTHMACILQIMPKGLFLPHTSIWNAYSSTPPPLFLKEAKIPRFLFSQSQLARSLC